LLRFETRSLLRLAGVAVISVFTARAARADEPGVSSCCNKWPPYGARVDGMPQGISIEVLEEAAKRADKHLRINMALHSMVDDGTIDASYTRIVGGPLSNFAPPAALVPAR
jgi:hypothetical protein